MGRGLSVWGRGREGWISSSHVSTTWRLQSFLCSKSLSESALETSHWQKLKQNHTCQAGIGAAHRKERSSMRHALADERKCFKHKRLGSNRWSRLDVGFRNGAVPGGTGPSGTGQAKFANASSLGACARVDWAVISSSANRATACAQPRLRPDRHPCPWPSVPALAMVRRCTGWHASTDAC